MGGRRGTARQVVRALARRPGFSALAIATVALAIAAITTVFSLVNGALLRPLPYAYAERLVTLDLRARTGHLISTSIPHWRELRDGGVVFESFAGEAGWTLTLTGEGDAESLAARAVVGDFFGTLGLAPLHGRVFGPEASPDRAGGDAVAVLGHGFWERRYAADPGVVGRVILLSGRPYTVVGVLPRGAGYPTPAVDAYVPMATLPDLPWDQRDSAFGTRIVARLAPGIGFATLASEMARLGRASVDTHGAHGVVPEPRMLDEYLLGDGAGKLRLLFAAVGCLLLIAIANLGHLMLARGEERRQELALRAALGADRRRVVAAVLVEALTLATVGGMLGLALAWIAVDRALPQLPTGLPAVVLAQVAVDPTVVGFGFLVALVTGVGFGLVAATRARDVDPATALRGGTRGATADGGRLRAALVVTEIALALVLLVGASLLLASLSRLQRVEKGFDAEGVLSAGVAAPPDRVADLEAWERFHLDLLERAAALPGVRSAALALLVPLSRSSWELRIHPESVPVDHATADSVLYNIVSPDYFATLGVPILHGRGFGPEDRTGAPLVAVIDETLAARYWPGENPLGKRVTVDRDADGRPLYRTVVGVTRNLRHYALDQPSRIQIYVPLQQTARTGGPTLRVLLRTDGDPQALIAPLRDAVRTLEPRAPLFAVASLDEHVSRALARERALSAVLAGFAAAALALAALGLFGVMAYTVARRTREIGIRVALGAHQRDVLRWIGGHALRVTVIGISLGLVSAALVAWGLRGVLFEVDALEPRIYAGVVLTLAAACALATWLPTRRALAVSPAVALTEA